MAGDTLVGSKLGGYRLESLLGEGTSAVVYASTAPDGTALAIKVIRASGGTGFEGRIARELKVLTRISHPNVVRLVNAGVDGGYAFFVFERAETSLQAMLDEGWRIRGRAAIELARDLLSGLAAVHAPGIVHRDVKPANVLRDASGRFMLTDFGFSRRDDAEESITATDTGVVVGTPHYLSPERWQRRPADARSDLYALGATLFHAASGRPPFEGDVRAVAQAHLRQAPPDLARVPDMPESIVRLVSRLLAKDPDGRPRDARAALDELEVPSTAPDPHRGTPSGRPDPHHPEFVSELGPNSFEPEPEPARAPAPVLFARFEHRFVQRGVLGRGGMGTVLRVLDENLSREVAMKVVSPGRLDPSSASAAFVVEARATARLEHPNVIPVHELGTDSSGRVYFVMRLVEGQTLQDRIAARDAGRPSEEHLQEHIIMLLKVVDAISFAHSKGILHCDLKPQNVMTGEFGEVYLVDWGLAQKKGTAPLVGADGKPSWFGTPAYISPEQVLGGAIDERTDVFGLGAILYAILTGGVPPYAAETRDEVLQLAREGPLTDPQQLAGGTLPPPLVAIALRALARDPAERYASAADLRAALERYLRGGLGARVVKYAAGARIVSEGEAGDAAFLITRGRCRVFKTAAGGERRVLREVGPGEVFGEIAVIRSEPRTASVEALDDVTVQVIGRDEFAKGLAYHPWLERIVQVLTERVKELDALRPGQ